VIEGPIGNVRHLVDEIDANRTDDGVDAVVVRIDSPGGEVAPAQELHAAISRLRDRKPVVASLGSVAASGGYYAAVAADSIVANPGTLTGSIGVILGFPTAAELMDKIGVRYEVFTSGDFKDMGSFARRPREAEEAVFDGVVADVYEQFLEAVMAGRNMTREEALAIADGRIYTGRQALDAGLIDRIGDLHQSVLLAAELAGIDGDPDLVRKARPLAPVWYLLDRLLQGKVLAGGGPRLEYRFR
jgi:protease-4